MRGRSWGPSTGPQRSTALKTEGKTKQQSAGRRRSMQDLRRPAFSRAERAQLPCSMAAMFSSVRDW